MPEGGAYSNLSVDDTSKDFVSFTMEPVEPDMEWAAFKLVATMADASRTIVFFTDPTPEPNGQFQILAFSADFSELRFDTGGWFGAALLMLAMKQIPEIRVNR